MSRDQTSVEHEVDPVLDPADEALLAQLLPPLDERPGPARRRSGATSGAMVKAVVDAALEQRDAQTMAMELSELPGFFPQAPAMRSAPVPASRFRRRTRAAVLIAAAVSLASLGAAAAVLVARAIRTPVAEPSVPAPVARPAPARAEAPTQVMEPLDLEVVAEPAQVREDSAGAMIPRKHGIAKLRHRAPAKAYAAPMAVGAEAGEELDLAKAPLEDLLAHANRLRRGREWRSADDVYQAVMARFPGSDAALVAAIASATLHVEQLKDAPGALQGYRRALAARPSGALAEEARWGIVEAQRALADGPGELVALRDFLEHHPVSALAPAAKRRVTELSR